MNKIRGFVVFADRFCDSSNSNNVIFLFWHAYNNKFIRFSIFQNHEYDFAPFSLYFPLTGYVPRKALGKYCVNFEWYSVVVWKTKMSTSVCLTRPELTDGKQMGTNLFQLFFSQSSMSQRA